MLWLMILLQVVLASYAAPGLPVAKPGCRSECGEVDVPFPFGIDPGCFLDGFELTCQENPTVRSHKLLINGNVEILAINLLTSQVRMNYEMSWQCFDKATGSISSSTSHLNFSSTQFKISHLDNKFFAIGCDTFAYTTMVDYKFNEYQTHCATACHNSGSLINGSCSGMGCCETPIPPDINICSISIETNFNSSAGSNFNACSYAVLMEADNFKFRTSYITTDDFWIVHDGTVPILMDWSISDGTCEAARNNTNYACISSNSVCITKQNGYGYICNCSEGYEGNPYLKDGCQDINECEDRSRCSGICVNTEGGYFCVCPPGTAGNPNNKTCYPTGHRLSLGIAIAIGIGAGATLLILFLAILVLKRKLEVRRSKKLKQKFFKQNHGLLLQRLFSSTEDTAGRMKIFSLEELEKATNNFDQTRILGCGGHGTVYKGILSDLRVVAIKRSKLIVQSEIDQFINEVVILSQINHRNVVRLFGCCLEAEVPLLVNEFISNGTLSDHLHVHGTNSLPWNDRLRIALEIARAISYLHSAASVSIFHRDIKCSNILLDDCLTAKLSDFGASKSVQIDETGITTAVQGTFGYLDPEYYHTGRLTEKSDVYSFGVILAELLTRQKAYPTRTSLENGSLIARFIMTMRENHLFEILDSQIIEEGPREQVTEVAVLTERCLRLRGEERPGMKEVEVRLEVIRGLKKNLAHSPVQISQSLHERRSIPKMATVGGDTSRQCSYEEEMLLSSKFAR